MSATDLAYLDTSALAKFVIVEAETNALRSFLQSYPLRASSTISQVELLRVARRRGFNETVSARALLAGILLLDIDDAVLTIAAELDPPILRSLDAIHLATALSLGSQVSVVVTYDVRMQEAARAAGLNVAAPA